MATTYPYISSAGPMVKTVDRFRKQFPSEVTADTLRKLGIAPKNESYVINIFKFLGLIDESGKKVEATTRAFVQNDDSKFAQMFAEVVKKAYAGLFELYGDEAWARDRDGLVTYFRESDSSSDVVGKRQALTFNALAALSGHGEMFVPRATSSAAKPTTKATPRVKTAKEEKVDKVNKEDKVVEVDTSSKRVGLTVRVEVNLPANGDQKTYDAIFQSIRKNLIDVE